MPTQTVSQNGRKVQTPLKAIRAKCIDCCCGQRAEVRRCQLTACPLWPFRLGKNPRAARGTQNTGETQGVSEVLSRCTVSEENEQSQA